MTPHAYGPAAPVVAALRARFGDRLSAARAVRDQHAHTLNSIVPQAPDAVVFPRSTEEVQAIVEACRDGRVPIVPFGAGSSVEGHVNAPFGGITVSTREMDAIVAVNAMDLDAMVQPGVTRTALNSHIRDTGLFFPIDPGADASLGGMASTRASGTNAVRYGTMKDVVLGLKAVLADGSVITTGGAARKSSAGYDLTRLLVGAEGTLGIITELRVKLSGIPEAVLGGVCSFPDVASACEAAMMAIQTGIPVARVELMDAAQVRACNAYSRLDLPEAPSLFVEFHGTQASVAEQAELFAAIAQDCGAGPFEGSANPEARSRIWQARHDAHWANLALRPGAKNLSTDVCVPISRLADCVGGTIADIESSGIVATIVGHVGDGNFHVQPLVDLSDPAEVEAVRQFSARLAARASHGEHHVKGVEVTHKRQHGHDADYRPQQRQLDAPEDLPAGSAIHPSSFDKVI